MVGAGSSRKIVFPADGLGLPNYELMQFTGLHDKDGKEIFEGDVIRAVDSLWAIQWDETNAGFWAVCDFARKTLFDDKSGLAWLNISLACSSAEVIGNIYETPQLLSV